MKREVKVTLSTQDVNELLVKVVAKKQKLPDGCACTWSVHQGELCLIYSLPEDAS